MQRRLQELGWTEGHNIAVKGDISWVFTMSGFSLLPGCC
jgi:hypothetical protein